MKSRFHISKDGPPDVRADFVLQVDEPAKEIKIIDEDLGNMSVTNDLERVLGRVAWLIDGELPDYSILYRDSTRTWDRVKVIALDAEDTFELEVLPGPREPDEVRDLMARWP